MRAGLARAGMVMARWKEGEGEGMRGRAYESWSNDMFVDRQGEASGRVC